MNWQVANVLLNVGEGSLVAILLYLIFCRWFPPKREDPPGGGPGGSLD